MANQKFAIQKQIVEAGLFSKVYAHEFQNRISHLVNYGLVQKMENYFDKVIPANLLFRIDQLVLDIGRVNWNTMEDEMEEKIMEALEVEFTQRLQLVKNNNYQSLSGISIETADNGKLELFEYFLLYGVLPWYADTAAKFNIGQLLNQLYNDDRSALRSLIQRTGKKENVRKRISYQFNDESIQQVINTIEPAEAEYIFQTHREIINIQRKKQIIKTGEKEFGKTIWLFIMNYLLAEMSSEFEKKMFVKSNIARIAAYYNINYYDLLVVFFEVVESEKQGKIIQPLKTVIYELFSDETEPVSAKILRKETIQTPEIDMLALPGKIRLLQYYLHFGSLPVSYERMSRADLANLLLTMAKIVPETVLEILLSLKTGNAGPSYLYQVIGYTEYKSLATLIMTGKESEIENIATMFLTFHEIQRFTYLNKEDFTGQIWKYLLDTLLFTGPAGYDESTIIKYLIKRMASMSGKTAGHIVDSLKDSLQKSAAPGREILRLHILFKEVLVSMSNSSARGENEDSIDYYREKLPEDENRLTAENTGEQLSDVLHFILQYGAVPWWGYDYHHFPIDELISRLYETDPPAMLLLFRKASLKPLMKARLLLNIPAGIFRNLLIELPHGNAAVLSIDEFLVLLDQSKLMKYYATEFLQKTIYSVAWNILTQSGYSLFSGILFYVETITQLSGLLNIKPGAFILAVIQSAEKVIAPVSTSRSKILLKVALDYFEEPGKTEAGPVKLTSPVAKEVADLGLKEMKEIKHRSTEILSLIKGSEVIQKHFDFSVKTSKMAVDELGRTLQYFLYWNTLPGTFGILDEDEQKKLLREIIMILFADDGAGFKSLIANETNSIVARGYLTELFAESEGGTEKRIAYFLVQVNLPLINLSTGHSAEKNFLPVPGSEDGDIDLFEIFKEETGSIEGEPGNVIIKGSERLMIYFLKYNRIPENITVKGAGAIERLLRATLLFLFIHHRGYIKEQFQRPDVSQAAKLYLYDLLAVRHDTLTHQLEKFIEETRETDLGNSLLQTGERKDVFNKEDWPSLIMNRLHVADADEKIKENYSFLSSPSFAKMVLDRFGMELFFKMAEYKINWLFTADSIVQGWVHFLQKVFPQGFHSEKIIELFNQFNIIFISGRLNIYNNDSYTTAFINYLSNQPGITATDILKQLFDYVSDPEKKPVAGVADQKNLILNMLRPEIVKLDELKRVEAGIIKEEERKMSLAFKEDITGYRKRQSEALKKETGNKMKPTSYDDQGKENKLPPGISDGIYIGNAGLVLFHPFLETYFNRTGLMENREFTDVASRNRAVLLLQYLATGKTEYAEHELVLNKILCDVPLEEAIPVSFTVSEQEIEVTRELLEVIIERWEKLKNTSPEGLQNSFILRDGKLNFIDDYWNLKVEQRGYDILLQTLPWAFGYIKTAWMQYNLTVEWI